MSKSRLYRRRGTSQLDCITKFDNLVDPEAKQAQGKQQVKRWDADRDEDPCNLVGWLAYAVLCGLRCRCQYSLVSRSGGGQDITALLGQKSVPTRIYIPLELFTTPYILLLLRTPYIMSYYRIYMKNSLKLSLAPGDCSRTNFSIRTLDLISGVSSFYSQDYVDPIIHWLNVRDYQDPAKAVHATYVVMSRAQLVN